MKKTYTFNEFMVLKEGGTRTAAKTELYPMGYGGIGLYPDAWWIPTAADAALYITNDERLYHNRDSAPNKISHLPGCKLFGDYPNNADGPPYDIRHVHGKSVPPKDSPLPDEGVPFKQWLKLVVKPTEISPPDSPNLPK